MSFYRVLVVDILIFKNKTTTMKTSKKSKKSITKKVFSDSLYSVFGELLNSLKQGKILAEDRKNLKKDVKQIYLKVQQIDKSISQTIWDENVIKLTDESIKIWENTKEKIISITQIPLRIEFISSTYIELIRLGKKADSIHEIKEKSTVLAGDLFANFADISNSYLQIFNSLLDISIPVNMSGLNTCVTKIKNLLNDFPVKYKAFCFDKSKDDPTPFLTYMEKYLNKIITRTEQMIEIGIDPFDLVSTFKESDEIFQQLCSTIDYDYNITISSIQKEKKQIKKAKSLTSSVYPFPECYFEDLDEKLKYADKSSKPWFVLPYFYNLTKLTKDMEELSNMLYTRQDAMTGNFTKKQTKQNKTENIQNIPLQTFQDDEQITYMPEIPKYGLKDVFNETIEHAQWRKEKIDEITNAWIVYKDSLQKRVNQFTLNEEFLNNLMKETQDENQNLENERQETVRNFEELQEKVLKELHKYLFLNDEENKKVQELDDSIRDVEDQIATLKAEKQRIINEQKPLIKKIQQTKEENEKIEEEINVLDDKIKETESMNTQVLNSIEAVKIKDKDTVELLKAEINKLEDEKNALDEPLEQSKIAKKKEEDKKKKLTEKTIPKLEDEYQRLAEELNIRQMTMQRAKTTTDFVRFTIMNEGFSTL